MPGSPSEIRKIFRLTIQELAVLLSELHIPAPDAAEMGNQTAFGAGVKSFEQWLLYVFLPRAKEIADEGSPLPKEALLGEASARTIEYFDEHPTHRRIGSLLRRLDWLCLGDLIEVKLNLIEEKFAKKGMPGPETKIFLDDFRKGIDELSEEEALKYLDQILSS